MEESKWKDARGDDLPEIDRVVVVLCQVYPLENNEYMKRKHHKIDIIDFNKKIIQKNMKNSLYVLDKLDKAFLKLKHKLK